VDLSSANNGEWLTTKLDVARAFASSGDFARAKNTLETVANESSNKDFALRDVAIKQAQSAEMADAIAMAELIKSPAERAEALIRIAALAQNTNKGKALELTREAVKLFRLNRDSEKRPKQVQLTPGERIERPLAAWQIVGALAEGGALDEAKAFANEQADRVGDKLGSTQTADAVLCLWLVGLPERAQELAAKLAEKLTTEQLDVARYGAAVSIMARYFAMSGQSELAGKALRPLLAQRMTNDELPQTIEQHSRLNMLLEAAEAFAENGSGEIAADILLSLKAQVDAIPAPLLRMRSLGSLLKVYEEIRMLNQASSIWNALLNEARNQNRLFFFDVIRYGTKILANMDQGNTLQLVYQSVKEVDAWWKAAKSASPAQSAASV